MYFLPNHKLAGFLEKQLFAEKRLLFVDKKDEEEIAKMLEGEVRLENEEPKTDSALTEIGRATRSAIDGIDTEGNFGIAGASRIEQVVENQTMSLTDLLREKTDYDDAIRGLEMKKEDFENVIGYELMGGKNGLPIKSYPELADNVTKKYNFLQEIRAGVAGQSKSTETVNQAIQTYREELEMERDEYLNTLKQERQSVLEKIVAQLEAEKTVLEQQVTDLKKICVEPEALTVEAEAGAEVGFLDYLKKKTDLEALFEKIRAGDFADEEVQEAYDQIQYFEREVESRKTSIEEYKYLSEHPEEKQEVVDELLKNVRKLLANYREKGGERLDASKKPKSQAEEKIVKQLLEFEARLQSSDLDVGEISFVDDVLSKFAKTLKTLRENENLFTDLAKLESEYAEKNVAEVEAELRAEIQKGQTERIPFTSDARHFVSRIKAELKVLEGEITPQNFAKFAFGAGQEKTEQTKKQWLLAKLSKAKHFNAQLQKVSSSAQESMEEFAERTRLESYFADLRNPDKNPVEVLNTLEKKGNLRILPAETFARKYKDTGITNSYFVIESTEYRGDVAKYEQDEEKWTIYLDESFYAKIQKGETTENEKNRFRARIAHELGHREFDAYKEKELKASGIYANAGWNELKTAFLNLNPEKKIGEDQRTVDFSDTEILNEIWALYKEHKVVPLKGKYGEFIQTFETLYESAQTKKTVRGAEAGTEIEDVTEDLTESKQEEKKEETTQVSEKQLEERDNFVDSLDKLEKILQNFGFKIPGKEEKKPTEKDKNKKQEGKLAQKFNANYSDQKEDFEKFIQETLPKFQNFAKNIGTSKRNSVKEMQNEIGHYLKNLQDLEKKFEEDDATQEQSYLEQLWNDTRFLSVDDVLTMVKETWEFAQRRRKRKADDARATVGKKIFGDTLLGNEYFSQQQKIEMDEVNNYQGNMSNMGHEQIYPLLYAPKNKDHLKAVITELCKRGRMRWDDPRVWDSMSRWTFISIPDREKAGNDIAYRNIWLKKMATDMWDENTWDEWVKTNDSGMTSSCNNFGTECSDFHTGGATPVRKEMDRILKDYAEKVGSFGEENDLTVIYPDHRYQKLLDIAFEQGKLSMEDKIYYLIEGVHKRVIPVEYLKKIQNSRFGVLPLLDFFYGNRNNTYADIEKLSNIIRQNGGNPNGVHKMIMQEIMTDSQVLTRARKRLSTDPSQIDHDDWQCILALTSPNIADFLLTRQGGGKPTISEESVFNAYASNPTFLKAQAGLLLEGGEKSQKIKYELLTETMSTFVMFDGIAMERFTSGRQYYNLPKSKLDYKPQGSFTIREYQQCMYDIIGEIFKRYYNGSEEKYIKSIFLETDKMQEKEIKKAREDGMVNDIKDFDKKITAIGKDPRGQEIIAAVLKEKGKEMPSYFGSGADFNYMSGRNNQGDN